jgi:hypothetical protein
MKGESKPLTAFIQREVARTEFGREGKNGLIRMRFRAVRDAENGETRVHVTIPDAEKIAFTHDMGVLLQSFGWGMASLGRDLEAAYGEDPGMAWHQCCQTISLVEYCLRLEPID